MKGGGGQAPASARRHRRLAAAVLAVAVFWWLASVAFPAAAGGRKTVLIPRGSLYQLGGRRGCVSHNSAAGCGLARGLVGAGGVAVSPDGRNVYVAANGDSAVVAFARNPRTGSLIQLGGLRGCTSESGDSGCATGRGLRGAFAVAVSPDGRNVYVTSDQAIAVFARDSRTGALTQVPGVAACVSGGGGDGCASARALSSAARLAISPDGNNIYVASVASNSVGIFARDTTTGALHQLPGQAGCTSAGGTDGCQNGRGLGGAFSVAVAPDGKHVYAAALSSNALVVFQRDPVDGELSEASSPNACTSESGSEDCSTSRGISGPNDLVVAPAGDYVYAASSGSSAVAALLRNQATGALDQLPAGDGCTSEGGAEGCATGRGLSGAYSVAVSHDGLSLYAAGLNSVAVFARGPSTGRLLQLAGERACFDQQHADGCSPGRGLGGASSVAVSPDGRSVYVASLQSGAVAVFARLPDPGSLSLTLRRLPRRCVSSSLLIRASASTTLPLKSLTVSLGRRVLARTTRRLLTRRVAIGAIKPGRHRLRVIATDQAGDTATRALTFSRCR